MHTMSFAQEFARQAADHPSRVAAYCGSGQITFGDLNRHADRVAASLRRQGVGVDVPVGISMGRSLEMLVGLLGIVKAGGAYLALDPTYPPARLAYMVADSGIDTIVCTTREEHLWNELSWRGRLERLDAVDAYGPDQDDVDDRANDAAPDGTLASEPVADALSYVIYTSGSTGAPKGVLGTSRGMMNRLQWMWDRFPFRADEIGCVKTSLNFLDSFWEIFGPLLQGVPVVVVPDDVLKDAQAFVDTLDARRVTRLVVVPSLLRTLLATVPDMGDRLRRLTLWVTSGEALTPELARSFRERLPFATLLNLYGASEVSADCAWYDVAEGPPERVAIGRPIDNNDIHVLDEACRPLSAGATGRLWVSGVGLARGYLKRPDLTAERFVPNPHDAAGGRMYDTGDLARWRSDGLLEFIGRADQQIKIRGFRVEPGEIEAALRQHPAVADAAIIARDDASGRRQLLGYVVPAAGHQIDGLALRGHLATQVPEYMVPAAIVLMRALPRTPSGKLDRQALPTPASSSSPGEPPRTPGEERLAGIFADVLELASVGIHDNFFDIGGDSLRSMDLVSQARAAGLAITSNDVFRYPSVAGLAALADPPSADIVHR